MEELEQFGTLSGTIRVVFGQVNRPAPALLHEQVSDCTEGGAPELLQKLAEVYVGPGTTFPPMPDPPPGFVTRIAVDRIAGQGPWVDAA